MQHAACTPAKFGRAHHQSTVCTIQFRRPWHTAKTLCLKQSKLLIYLRYVHTLSLSMNSYLALDAHPQEFWMHAAAAPQPGMRVM